MALYVIRWLCYPGESVMLFWGDDKPLAGGRGCSVYRCAARVGMPFPAEALLGHEIDVSYSLDGRTFGRLQGQCKSFRPGSVGGAGTVRKQQSHLDDARPGMLQRWADTCGWHACRSGFSVSGRWLARIERSTGATGKYCVSFR